MAYQSNLAFQLDANREAQVLPSPRPLSLHEGGGVDARVRHEASHSLSLLVRSVVAITLVLAVLGGLRVVLTVQTVNTLKHVNEVESNVSEALDARNELMMERSVLSNTDRIQRIATENYGMIYANEVETITVKQAVADEAQDVQDADAALAEA